MWLVGMLLIWTGVESVPRRVYFRRIRIVCNERATDRC